MSKKTDNSRQTRAGIPRPYASTNLPTPDEILKRLFAPLAVWEALVLFAVFVASGTYWVSSYSSIPLNMFCVYSGGILTTTAIVTTVVESQASSRQSVPSIADVQRSAEYSRLASILTLATVGSGTVSIVLLLAAGVVGGGLISPFVLFCVVVIGGLMFLFSYGVVRSLVSYVPQFSDSVWESLVENTSLFETTTVLGMISCPVALFSAGFLWNQPQIITIEMPISVMGAVVMMAAFLCVYVAAVNRV